MEKQNKKQKDKLIKSSTSENSIIPILAHDLRTPMNTIIGFSELSFECLENKDYENLKLYLGIISKHAKIANRQISSLAEWGFDFQKNIKNVDTFDISELIDHLIENHIELSNEKNIEIIKSLVFNSAEILGNQQAIEIVLRNLISNAIKFTNEGGKVEILGFEKDETIEIILKDNGIGIEQNEKEKIFNNNVSKLGTANEKGFGIGLSLCKRIIDNLNERIWIISKQGKGTEFHFTISQKMNNFDQNKSK